MAGLSRPNAIATALTAKFDSFSNQAGNGEPDAPYGVSLNSGAAKLWAAATQAALFADLAHDAGTFAYALDSGRVFIKVGASGSGHWKEIASDPKDLLKGSLFPDPLFLCSGGDTSFEVEGIRIYSSTYNNMAWDPTISTPFGQGAWVFDSGSSTLMGFVVPLTLAELASLNLDAGEEVSLGSLVRGKTADRPIKMAARFFDSVSPTSWVGAQLGTVTVTADLSIQLMRSEGLTIPATAVGLQVFFFQGSPAADFEVIGLWVQKGSRASAIPPVVELLPQRRLRQNKTEDYEFQDPKPDQLQITPRLYGVHGAGLEMNVYPANLHSSILRRIYNFVGSSGKQQSERWTLEPSGDITGQNLELQILDPHSLRILDKGSFEIDVVSNTAAGAVNKKVICIGDSTTNAGVFTQRLLDLSTANPSALQLTLVGTRGAGSNKHEGRGGWTAERYHTPGATYYSDNPFTSGSSDKFSAAFYLSDTGEPTPDAVVWHLGINDVFTKTTDADVDTAMTAYLTYLDQMIGVEVAADVDSWLESNASIKNLICVPIVPAIEQDAFGAAYGVSYHRARYYRNIQIAARRIIDHYSGSEGSGIFLVPWNASIDPEHNFQRAASDTYNAHTADTVQRQSDDVHPASSGYYQMGDALWCALNVLQVRGLL